MRVFWICCDVATAWCTSALSCAVSLCRKCEDISQGEHKRKKYAEGIFRTRVLQSQGKMEVKRKDFNIYIFNLKKGGF